MTQDEIVAMAIEARLAFDSEEYPEIWQTYMNVGKQEIEAFAKLVAAKEREALAQEQAPVAWGVDWGRAGDIPCVSIIKRLPNGGIEVVAVEYAPYSKTATPQRTWQGLTDEEIQECYSEAYKIVQGRQLEIAFYKTIEAKLKLKNGYAEEKNT